ncbi:MAG TPA: methyltransferase [Solirubrobacteraceae bacterium]|nr:methyltransferase [Solirubrobacteraceae bacterium]
MSEPGCEAQATIRRPPEAVLWDFLRGALMTRALAVVADAGIADALAGGPKDIAQLASEVGADSDVLERLMNALASDGLFERFDDGVFANTDASELLRDPAQRALAHLFGAVYYRAVAELDATGAPPAFARAHGTDLWHWLAENPTEREVFDRAMLNGVHARAERLGRLQWRGDEVIVDIGGGDGSLLIEFLRDRLDMRGIVFDLPEAMHDDARLGDRIDFVAGSFFDRVPEGDAYILSAVLHDWDDEPARAILDTIRRAARERARVVIVDGVLEPRSPPVWRWADLHILATLGGRERDETSWRRLLASGGFEPLSVGDGLIEARAISPAP